MIPEIKIVGRSIVDWSALRTGVLKLVGLEPSATIAQSPVNFTPDAELLLFNAILLTESTEEPANILAGLPRECLDFLHYTFLIKCDEGVVGDLREKTRACYTMVDCGAYYCVLGTGPLSVWHDAIVLNLTHPNMILKGVSGTRFLLDKMMLLLEYEGLTTLFSRYNKTTLPDKTFLLE